MGLDMFSRLTVRPVTRTALFMGRGNDLQIGGNA